MYNHVNDKIDRQYETIEFKNAGNFSMKESGMKPYITFLNKEYNYLKPVHPRSEWFLNNYWRYFHVMMTFIDIP